MVLKKNLWTVEISLLLLKSGHRAFPTTAFGLKKMKSAVQLQVFSFSSKIVYAVHHYPVLDKSQVEFFLLLELKVPKLQ